ncbi:hypothetical protein [Rubripirellula reticaptiva]|uniref:Uncharacterized protein n=1 Tax=Rubripirellula reticaptiva TaxID=2528013 RepID=A0A5C6EH68_9BACT|nr:hypothetical protein [Rubripirellula reticaptiva]TWU46946.1 hypothetical protein Poly59_59200 [Rubripirellula reticaptiva]
MQDRRQFVRSSIAVAAGGMTGLSWLPKLKAGELDVAPGHVRFSNDIEPLVQFLENTPRNKIIDGVLEEIRTGRSYQELLAALFLAGIRNVQPRPSVGFKFHSVLVVHSAHQASLAAVDQHRWTPLLWSIDYFKSAQESDVREGDWTMSTAPSSKLPEPTKALHSLDQALTRWDVEAADAAATIVARTASAGQILNLLAKHAARDYRSIGHKSIYLANAYRTLGVIGWQHCEPVVRSLCYAILNHTGDPNPANSDLKVDRVGRSNWERVNKMSKDWLSMTRKPTESATVAKELRTATPDQAADFVVQMINSGCHPESVYDGIMIAAAEMVSRQAEIVPLHAVTTSNAMRFLYRNVYDDRTRQWMLLQNAAMIPHFRESAEARGRLSDVDLLQLDPAADDSVGIENLFDLIGTDRKAAAESVLNLAQQSSVANRLIGRAREFVFLKGNDAHDYKFSSATLEDYYQIDPIWRSRYLAGCSYLLHGEGEETTSLAKRVLQLE